MILAERAVIPVKTSTGESDLQARYISFDQVPFLRKNEQTAGFRVFLWNTGVPSTVAIYPNLTTGDPVMRPILQDRRFRQALSLAVNRQEINHILYYGLGLPGQNTVLRSPAGHEEPRNAYARFDLPQANRLLDEMGLTNRDGRGFRLRPDGQRLDLIVETSGEETEHTDVLELVKDAWADLGIELLIRPSQLEVFRRRVFSGEAMMSAAVTSPAAMRLAIFCRLSIRCDSSRPVMRTWSLFSDSSERMSDTLRGESRSSAWTSIHS